MEILTQVMTFLAITWLSRSFAHSLTVPFFSCHLHPCPLSCWHGAETDLLRSALSTRCIFRFSLYYSETNTRQARLCVNSISGYQLPVGLPQVAQRWAKGSNRHMMLAGMFLGSEDQWWEKSLQNPPTRTWFAWGCNWEKDSGAVLWKSINSHMNPVPHHFLLHLSVHFLFTLGCLFPLGPWAQPTGLLSSLLEIQASSQGLRGLGGCFSQEGQNQEWDKESCIIEKVELVNWLCFRPTFGCFS